MSHIEPTPVQPSTAGEEVVRDASYGDVRAWLRSQGFEVSNEDKPTEEQVELFEAETGLTVIPTATA